MKYTIRKTVRCRDTMPTSLCGYRSLVGYVYLSSISDVNVAYQEAEKWNYGFRGCGCRVEVFEVSE